MSFNQTRAKPNFLRLVDARPAPDPIAHDMFVRTAWQTTLFANENPSLLLFVNFEEISEDDFKTVLSGARAKFLFDLRRVPRFDLGNLSRKHAFTLFSKIGTRYLDLSGQLSAADVTADEYDPEILSKLILDSSNQAFAQGPLAFLVDPQHFEEGKISRLVEALPSHKNMPWDVLRVPLTSQDQVQPLERTIVFISHANPEDNAFAAWLAGQLSVAGYSVWSDITQLVGGETFWDDIEATIRFRTAKFIAVLSESAQQKPGVLDEIDLAVRIERSHGLKGFVLPIRLDELSYSDVRANIARKNIVDFKDNWASGLYSILSALERDGVPRDFKGNSGDALSRWVTERCTRLSAVVTTPETLTSNWLRINHLPEYVFLHSVSAPVEQINSIVQSLRQPTFRYLRLIGSFATAEDLQRDVSPRVALTNAYRVRLQDFLLGKASELPGLPRWEAGKLMASLLRQAWNLNMERAGLLSFETASGHLAWFMPKGFVEGDWVEFWDDEGKKRRKALVGWSARRNVFWHFAVEARPILGEFPHFVLRQHVIFTSDGKSPIESKERMHLLRRRFCKSWWNDRWRDLLIAFVTWLCRTDQCALVTGSDSSIHHDEGLMRVVSPVSVASDSSLLPSPADPEDELDSDEEIDSFGDEEGGLEDRESSAHT
jgi:hypothetical protein